MLNHHNDSTPQNPGAEPSGHSRMFTRLMILVFMAAFIKLLYLYLEKERDTISERLWLTEDRVAMI